MTAQARTNLGPLTTAFSYPASCTVNVLMCATCNAAWQGQICSDNPNNVQGVEDNPGCWPPRSNSALSTGVALNGWGFYSPGISCPVGYQTACTAVGGSVAGFGFQFSPSQSETAVGCCPPNYTCQYDIGSNGQTCVSFASTGSFPAVQCSFGTSNGFSFVTAPATVPATLTSGAGSAAATISGLVTISTIELFAPLFQLMHQQKDLPLTSGGHSSLTDTASTTANTGGAANTGSSSASLSPGAIAGIAVGSVVVGLGLIGALVYLLLSKRRQQRQKAEYAAAPSSSGASPGHPPVASLSEFPGDQSPLAKNAPIVYAPVYEVPSETQRHELP